ncbi:hypothetical protein [Cellulosilyticum sp. I15G10I2]|uniref:hypothetical protein n=1 Tax=Cellulosilyticum sp. I15G10I2 TaxID=1892843 RepID=UPI00085BBE5D|nr:hypothetical protein [Cellulosilyticum sp. I15G10I2]
MEELVGYLSQIQALLEQVYTITDNQTTILLAPMDTKEEESNALDMIAQMADYKDELTEELNKLELAFQQKYDELKEVVKYEADLHELKRLVAAILEAKQAIIEHEQSNLLLLQTHSKKKLERVQLPQNPKEAANAYKKQQGKT